MAGNRSRRRGKDGEIECRNILTERGWEVDDLTDGAACADFVALDPQDRAWSVEVKKCKAIDIPAFIAQAKRQAGRKRWMLLAHIHGTRSYLCLRQGERPVVWHR